MIHIRILLGLISSFSLFANPSEESSVIKGISLLSDFTELQTVQQDVFGICLENIDAPGGNEPLIERLTSFLDMDLTHENIVKIKEEILAYYQEHQQPFVSVRIPEQEITKGTVAVVVTEGKIESIRFSGNTNFSDKVLKRYLTIEAGDPVDKELVLSDVSWMNRNPFHRSEVIFSPGKTRGSVDLDIITKDRRRVRIFGGADNTGNDFTGNARYYAGFNIADFLFSDIFTFQFTTAQKYSKFNAYTANYTVFLPWKHTLNIWGGYAEIRPLIRGLRNEGKDAQASFRYVMPFKPIYRAFTHEVDVGFDFKQENSALFFTSAPSPLPIVLADPTPVVPLIANTVNLAQLFLAYKLEYDLPKLLLTFQIENFCSPAHWLPDQTNSNYNQLRLGAKNIYFYQKAAFGAVYRFDELIDISWLVRGQVSTTPLLPSEQFGLGGYDTVRGYDEREILADNAICTNLELRSHPFRISPKIKNECFFLVFMDYGFGSNIENLPTQKNPAYLLSVGPGMRYTIIPYLILRADYGFQLHKTQFNRHHVGKFNLGGTFSF